MMLFIGGVLIGFALAVVVGLYMNAKKGRTEATADEADFCLHPSEHVENLSAFGSPHFRCKACGAESTAPFPITLN